MAVCSGLGASPPPPRPPSGPVPTFTIPVSLLLTPTRTTTPPLQSSAYVHVAYVSQKLGGSTGTVVASCAPGEVALSGGWDEENPINRSNGNDSVERSSRSANGWQDVVAGFPGDGFGVFVLCLGQVAGAAVRERFVTASVPANGSSPSTFAACSSSEVLVGGGFGVTPGVEVSQLLPSGNGWGGVALNHTGDSGGVTFFAECLSAPGAQSLVMGPVVASVPAGQDGGNGLACPSGAFLSGGGYSDDGNASVYVEWPGSVSGPPTLWNAFLYAKAGYPQTLHVDAMCLRFS
jgi:hypothetical protein